MNIEQMQNEIKRYQSALEELPNKRLGFMLKDYYYANLTMNTKRSIIENDKFLLEVYPRDTGVGVDSKIKLPDGTFYKFAYRTYWYNESHYGFNKWTYENGAWDEAYNNFIEDLRSELNDHYLNSIQMYNDKITVEKGKALAEKQKVESLFN